jgi:hypothetical protein
MPNIPSPVGVQDAAAAQQFAVVAEPSAALRVEAAGARGERL